MRSTKKVSKKNEPQRQFSPMQFSSIKMWVSPKTGSKFFMVRFGRNTCFLSEALLEKIKKDAA